MGDYCNVAHGEAGVGRRLDQHQPAAGHVGLSHVRRRAGAHGHAHRLELDGQQVAHIVIAVRRHQHRIAGPQHRIENRGNRGHAGWETDNFGVLKDADLGLHCLDGRIAIAAIEMAAIRLARQVESGGGHDRQ